MSDPYRQYLPQGYYFDADFVLRGPGAYRVPLERVMKFRAMAEEGEIKSKKHANSILTGKVSEPSLRAEEEAEPKGEVEPTEEAPETVTAAAPVPRLQAQAVAQQTAQAVNQTTPAAFYDITTLQPIAPSQLQNVPLNTPVISVGASISVPKTTTDKYLKYIAQMQLMDPYTRTLRPVEQMTFRKSMQEMVDKGVSEKEWKDFFNDAAERFQRISSRPIKDPYVKDPLAYARQLAQYGQMHPSHQVVFA